MNSIFDGTSGVMKVSNHKCCPSAAEVVLEKNTPLRSALESRRASPSDTRIVTNDNFGNIKALWELMMRVHVCVHVSSWPCSSLDGGHLSSSWRFFFPQSSLWSSSILLTSLSPSSTDFSSSCESSQLYYICIFFPFSCRLQSPEFSSSVSCSCWTDFTER